MLPKGLTLDDMESNAPEAMSLDELITTIDRETERSADVDVPETVKIKQAPALNKPGTRQYIEFFLNNIVLCLPLANALEIGRQPEITPLPNLPSWIYGVSNIRGEIVSMVDLKGFFGMPALPIQSGRRFIIACHQNIKVGLLVDRIAGILSLDQLGAVIQASPYQSEDTDAASQMSRLVSFITGVISGGEELINILDITGLLLSPRMNAFQAESENM